MKPQRGAATGDAEESESNDAEQQPTDSLLGSEDDMLNVAREMGAIIGEPKIEDTESEEPSEEDEPGQTESSEEEEPGEEETPEESDEQKEEPERVAAEAEPKSIDEQIRAFESKGQKVPWYLTRIADESQKRRERTEELRTANLANEGLRDQNRDLLNQLTQAQAPRPNQRDPLADIFNETGLRQMEGVYRGVIRLAELHPEGAFEIPVKQPDGSEVKQDFTREQLVDMKLEAEEMLRSGIPQRRNYLVQRSRSDAETGSLYPELTDQKSNWVSIGRQLLAEVPELQRSPDCWRWIARAIRGWQVERAQQSKAKPNGATQVAAAKKQVKAPIVPRTRGLVRRREGSDEGKALDNLKNKGDAESAVKYLEASGFGSRRGAGVE